MFAPGPNNGRPSPGQTVRQHFVPFALNADHSSPQIRRKGLLAEDQLFILIQVHRT
jgi:hypothetical protein